MRSSGVEATNPMNAQNAITQISPQIVAMILVIRPPIFAPDLSPLTDATIARISPIIAQIKPIKTGIINTNPITPNTIEIIPRARLALAAPDVLDVGRSSLF